MSDNPFRAIPSMDSLMRELETDALQGDAFVAFVSQRVEAARTRISRGEALTRDELIRSIQADLERFGRRRLEPVINATGVVLHTNLGRSPVSEATARAMAVTAGNYGSLELEPESGHRGGRMREISDLMRLLTGAEATLVVNNNAAAVLLTLAALAAGREVIVSRGEAVEIGGGFRIPDVLTQSGARLVDVGTTNRTYPGDFEQAAGPETAVFLKVHASNFRVDGFTRTTSVTELKPISDRLGIPIVEDLGSGALLDVSAFGLAHEPTIAESIAAGAAVVTTSGDKLLGGPQAGIIAGRRELILRIERHPLMRALRADKTCLAGIAETLRHYARGDATREIPIWRMIATAADDLRSRAESIVDRLAAGLFDAQADCISIHHSSLQTGDFSTPAAASGRDDVGWRGGLSITGHPDQSEGISRSSTEDQQIATRFGVVATESAIGGGSLPGQTQPSFAVRLSGVHAESLARELRTGTPGVFGRIEQDVVLLDLRTVLPEQDTRLEDAIQAAISRVVARRA